ncbi:MAG TPA: hypothetical protein ENI89_05335 [Desulfobulbus sp.]|nr:hypothetical protein [Desulfobulbus sp.]
MLYIERDQDGHIVAIRQGQAADGLEPASLLDEEVLSFLRGSGEIDALAQVLSMSDASIIRVLEDLVDVLVRKKVILFTDLPAEAQEKIRQRQRMRRRIGHDQIMVDDIL